MSAVPRPCLGCGEESVPGIERQAASHHEKFLTRIPAALAQLNFKPFPKPGRNPATGALTVDDLRLLARRRAPTAAFDYADGGSYSEETLDRNYRAYRNVELVPGILRDVSWWIRV